VPWAQTFLCLVSFDSQPEVKNRLARFTYKSAFPELMRALSRRPPTYRIALCHLEKYCGRLKFSGASPYRLDILSSHQPSVRRHLHALNLPPPNTTEPTNRRVYIDSNGEEVIHIEFFEEPLGMTAADGQGYAQFEFGEIISKIERYIILRKLGWGMNSSVWMAYDTE
jgi:hypothetical protein